MVEPPDNGIRDASTVSICSIDDEAKPSASAYWPAAF
jgi:hypothetical protein